MKLYINNFDKVIFETKLQHLKDIDFSLFVDAMPTKNEDLSSFNILVLQEPNEYFGLHTLAVKNKDWFSVILTWDDYVLNNCPNAVLLPFGHTWFNADQYEKQHDKTFEIAHLRGKLLKTYGHQIRWDIFDRKHELSKPIAFYDTYGDRYNIEEARHGKEFIFGNSMFGIAIENTSHNGYFTEKILDCFLMRTIPLYWGCSDIDKYFNFRGIVTFQNADDFIKQANKLTVEFYMDLNEPPYDIIEENYQKALKYVNYEQSIIDKITEIFKLNGLL